MHRVNLSNIDDIVNDNKTALRHKQTTQNRVYVCENIPWCCVLYVASGEMETGKIFEPSSFLYLFFAYYFSPFALDNSFEYAWLHTVPRRLNQRRMD